MSSTERPTITTADLDRAGAQLAKSERGRQVTRDLLRFIQEAAAAWTPTINLPISCFCAAWGEYPGSVRDVLLEVI